MEILGKVRGALIRLGALTDGQILVGQTGGKPLPKTITGDLAIDADGVATVSGVSASGMSDLASTANAKGASLIGVEDAAGLITGATVEAALAEHQLRLPTNVIADPGTGVAIPVTKSGSLAITTAAAETNTLADPTFRGQRLALQMNVRAVGDRVVTAASRINQAGNTVMTFGAAGDFIALEAITVGGALKWQVVSNDGVALS